MLLKCTYLTDFMTMETVTAVVQGAKLATSIAAQPFSQAH
jgi:hypothetical protein